jgi:tetratricopeptide (TPR) repeat protein
VFAGDFDLRGVAAVASVDEFEALDLVEQLVDKSMLEVDATQDRYRLLETLRQYAWDRLVSTGRLGTSRDNHARHYLALAGEHAALMRRAGKQVEALDGLEADYDNLRAALAYLIETEQAELAAQMVRRVAPLFHIRHPREGLGWFERVVAIADDLPAETKARLLSDASHAAHNAGDFDAVAIYASAALDVGGDDVPPLALWTLAQWRLGSGDYGGAADLARKAVPRSAAMGDAMTQSMATGTLASALMGLGETDEARVLIPEIIRVAEELGNPTVTGAAYMMAADVVAMLGDGHAAADLYRKASELSDTGGPIIVCSTRVGFAMETDDLAAAREAVLVSLATSKEQLSGYYQLNPLLAAARLLALGQRPELAARVIGTVRANAGETLRSGWVSPILSWPDQVMALIASSVDAPTLELELERGGRLSVDQALELAIDELARQLFP